MQINKIFMQKVSIFFLVVSLLSACGGGGSSSSTSSSNPGSTSTASFFGPIVGIGSIVLNGIRFETVGVPVTDSDDLYGTTLFSNPLSLGMTVALGGDVNETALAGTPSKIRVIGGVRGQVDSTTGTTITTLNGQDVTVDTSTIYAGLRSSLADLVAGDYVEIYGITKFNGDFLATRVVSYTAPTINQLAIRGTLVSSPSANNYVIRTSSSATVTVSCNPSATPACAISPAGTTLTYALGPIPGTPVRVIAADTTSLNAGVLRALKVQVLSPEKLSSFAGLNPSFSKINGLTSKVDSVWYVGNVKVTGYNFSAEGQYVEVKGILTGNSLQATKVETETDKSVNGVTYKNEFYGAISGISGNYFVVQGVLVDATTATIVGGTLVGLADGNYVEVKGTLNNGILDAIRVEVKTASNASSAGTFAGAKFEVYGTVSGWTNPSNTFIITELGSPTVSYVALASSAVVPPGIANGSVVEVKGSLDSNQQFKISKIELKDPNFRYY